MSKSSKRPMKSWFNAKNAAMERRQRNREKKLIQQKEDCGYVKPTAAQSGGKA